jgi:membrane-associated phospholipid phosphatase
MSEQRREKEKKRRRPLTLSDAVLVPENWSERIAHWISLVGSPPVLGILGVMLITFINDLPSPWTWVALYVVSAIGLPLVYLVWLVRRGAVTDIDVQLRKQRSRPFLAMMAGQTIAWFLLNVGGAPTPLPRIAGAYLAQTTLILLITLRWKISVHTATAAGVTVAVWQTLGSIAVPFALTLPLIIWSRVKLGRHTLGQTLAGTALGASVFLTALLLGGR